jgi:hypothetical protein
MAQKVRFDVSSVVAVLRGTFGVMKDLAEVDVLPLRMYDMGLRLFRNRDSPAFLDGLR